MTSVYSINFPPAWLMAGGYFGLIQASRNTLQIKQRQLTVKHVLLPAVLLTFSQQNWWRREKPTSSLGNESYVLGWGDLRRKLDWNNCPAPSLHQHCFSGQDCFGKVTARPAWAFSAFSGNHAGIRCVCCLWSHYPQSVVLRVTQRSCLQWEQDGFPVQINLGQGMALFSVELARQNKENKKKANAQHERKKELIQCKN